MNVFLGLGLPWLIASSYELAQNDQGYSVNTSGLDFSVMLFLITCVVGLGTLILRRCVGAEFRLGFERRAWREENL